MKSGLAWVFAVVTLVTTPTAGAYSMMTDELVCRLPVDSGPVARATLLVLCRDLSQRLNATLRLDPATEMSRDSLNRTIFVLEVSVKSAAALTLAYAFGPAAAWKSGAEVRFDDLEFEVMDARIDETTILRLVDTLVGLSAEQK